MYHVSCIMYHVKFAITIHVVSDHTQNYVVEVLRLVELNPNILVWHVERMLYGQYSTVQSGVLH